MKRNGFTMAETLITLGIIGFVAAIMIPALFQSQPNRELLLMRKAYYLTSRIVSELINDEDFYPEREESNRQGFSNISIRDQLGHEATYHGKTYGGGQDSNYPGNQKFCGLFASRLNTKNEPVCIERSINDGGNFETLDGILWKVPITNFPGRETILIDVNGLKGPNCTPAQAGTGACPYPDRFVFRLDRYGKLTIDSNITKEYLSGNFTSKSYKEIVEILKKRRQMSDIDE